MAIQELSTGKGGAEPPWKQSLGRYLRQNKLGAISGLFLALIVIASVFADVISPYGINEQTGPRLSGPSWEHPLGTDQLGRDLFSRVLAGSRASLIVGFGAAILATVIGTVAGILSAYLRGVTDAVLQRITDAMMAIPPLFIALALIASVATPSLWLIIVAVAFGSLPNTVRIIRSASLAVASEAYIESARASGATGLRVMLVHVLPNVLPYTLVVSTVLLGNAILVEAALSFLGLGVQPPTPSWGGMLSGSVRTYMLQAPWLAIPPGVALTLTVLAFNLFGDSLRDHLDPRLRGR